MSEREIWMFKFSRLTIALIVTVSLFLPSSNSFGQRPSMEKFEKKAKKKISEFVGKWGEILKGRLELRIGDMDAVCELEDEQIEQLKFAAKGAVVAIKKDMKKQADEMYEQMFGEGGWAAAEFSAELADEMELETVDESEDEDADAEFEDVADGDDEESVETNDEMMMSMGMNFDDYFDLSNQVPTAGMVETKIEKTKVWTKAVKKILTKDQAKKYKLVVEERNESRVDAVSRGFVSRVDRSMLLSAEQKEKLFELVRATYGEKLLAAYDNPYRGYMSYSQDDDEPDEETPFTKLLTPPQVKIWNATYKKELSELEMMGGQSATQITGGFF